MDHPVYPRPSAERSRKRHDERMEAIWVAAEMRAGGAFAPTPVALATMADAGDATASGGP